MAASEEETARRDSTFHGLTRGRWQPLVRDSKFGQRQQLLQSRGSRRRTIEDEQPLRRRRLLQRPRLLNEQRQRSWRWEPLDGVLRSTDSFDGLGGSDTSRSASGLRRRTVGGRTRKTTGNLRISEGGKENRRRGTGRLRLGFL